MCLSPCIVVAFVLQREGDALLLLMSQGAGGNALLLSGVLRPFLFPAHLVGCAGLAIQSGLPASKRVAV
ncbi:hypothetical protein CAL20_18055 [Bordetella genomosp. 4]|uniref:Uncharacterized protein n=1 Tax=Bordetella genomosp. 4 TaxID=463044 RepID=A0A261TXH2_9BORD|nr:hypothetical protein CAL21_14370 [Bordetella genomosp. 4]OZI54386.1 hypothetical protein CAL20_18055 [Bordetella genomosp. 4]